MGIKQTLITNMENTIFIDFLLKNGREKTAQKVEFDVIIPETLDQQMTCSVTVWGAVSFEHVSIDINVLNEMKTQIKHVALKSLETEKNLEKEAKNFVNKIKEIANLHQKFYIFSKENLA